MKKAPKVLTRMRLSCYCGDNLDEKELNDVVNYINELEQQCKKQKEVIDKIKHILNNQMNYREFVDMVNDIEDILKEVSQ